MPEPKDPDVAVPFNAEPFVTADETAKYLSLKRRQVLELARAGDLPAHPITKGKRRTSALPLGGCQRDHLQPGRCAHITWD